MVNKNPHGYFSPTPGQLRAARAALDISVQVLAERASLGVNTIRRAETDSSVTLTRANAERLVQILQDLGVTFLEADADGPGLRVRADREKVGT